MNKKYLILAAVLVIAAVCAAGAFYILSDDDNNESYPITYVLNGGVNSELNVNSYQSGNEYILYSPVSEDLYFYAWYLDENFETECTAITPDMRGDLTLYAKWSEDLEGKGVRLTVSGSVKSDINADYEVSGTETYMYRYYDETADRYFMSNLSEYTYVNGSLQKTKNYEENYWDDEKDLILTYMGEKEIDTINGKKMCEVWQVTDSQGSFVKTEYIGDGWIPYLIIHESETADSNTYVEYKYAEDFTFETSDEYSVQAYGDMGIIVSGSGKYSPGETAVLTAEVEKGTEFKGWYDAAGRLLSDELSYEIEVVDADIIIYAMNYSDPDFIYNFGSEFELSMGIDIKSAEWKLIDKNTQEVIAEYSGSSPVHTFDAVGEYVLYVDGEYNGSEYHGYCTIVITTDVDRTYTWAFEGHVYTYDLTIDYADVVYYRNLYAPEERWRGSESHTLSFITSNDKYILKIASDLQQMAAGMSDLQTANFLLKFVQSTEYVLDEISMGYVEYLKFPLETLFDMGGDCEDTAILFCALADAMGYDTALFSLPDHVASGIAVDGCKGVSFTADSKMYYYCETTSDTDVGISLDEGVYNKYTVEIYVV